MNPEVPHEWPAARHPNARLAMIARTLLAALLALLGIFLLIATKSTAGSSLLLAAVLVAIPLQRFGKAQRVVFWSRAALITILVALAIASIAGTDVVPEQAKTGVKFIDQLAAIWQRFQENLFGSDPRLH